MTVEPIRIEVVRWKCPFCTKSSGRRPGIRPHIETCFHNPEAEACGTCWRYEPATDGEEAQCVSGFPLTEVVPDKWNPEETREVMVRHCKGWLLKPELDEERRPEAS